uniref:Uncharacterized protein n=1 Tax=Gadus morhua TaxID=8049 RepID=A0A8C5BS49_GADMO
MVSTGTSDPPRPAPHLTPLVHTALLRRVSTRTSGVPISFTANLRISLMARGALFLKLLERHGEKGTVTHTPWMRLWMLMVYSLVTTSLMAERPFFFSPFFVGCIRVRVCRNESKVDGRSVSCVNESRTTAHAKCISYFQSFIIIILDVTFGKLNALKNLLKNGQKGKAL